MLNARGEPVPMDANALTRDVIEPMASDALRTIGVAYRDFVFGVPAINELKYDAQTTNWEDEEHLNNSLTTVGNSIIHAIICWNFRFVSQESKTPCEEKFQPLLQSVSAQVSQFEWSPVIT
jgi:hypothetical protein